MRGPQPWKTNRARVLRSARVAAETKLWHRLRSRKLGGWKFVRQAPVIGYFADFLCREANLIVEVDGATHGDPVEIARDHRRTTEFESLGYRVVRFWNCEIDENLDGVLDRLLAELGGPLNHPTRSRPSP